MTFVPGFQEQLRGNGALPIHDGPSWLLSLPALVPTGLHSEPRERRRSGGLDATRDGHMKDLEEA